MAAPPVSPALGRGCGARLAPMPIPTTLTAIRYAFQQLALRMLRPVNAVTHLRKFVFFDAHKKLDQVPAVNKGVQILLTLKYQELLRSGAPLPSLRDVEFRAYSQTGEDGILLYIFALLGITNRRAVEICAGNGTTCNTANLIINHGWHGLLFDGNYEQIRFGQRFYAQNEDTFLSPPHLVHAWITRDNVNELITRYGFQDEIDLLSLDLDGVDYWIWQAINCIQPRVVVVEFSNMWGPDRAVTVPYHPDFRSRAVHPHYCGASLAAFIKLGRQKGYRFVGTQRYGFNAFFIRDGLAEDILPEVDPHTCFTHPQIKIWQSYLHQVSGYEWVEV